MNRLTNVVHESVWKASFEYNANGNNVAQASPLAETDSSGTITRYYVWAGFQLLAYIEADGTTRCYPELLNIDMHIYVQKLGLEGLIITAPFWSLLFGEYKKHVRNTFGLP